jgi:formylglycine-generating enzyme required for sulfatase activity
MSPVKSSSTDIATGAVFRDGPSLPEMVAIAEGSFWMISSEQDAKIGSTLEKMEKTRHWVRIVTPFAIGKFPVTFDQWDAFCDSHPDAWRPDDNARGNLPVCNVSWEDAQAYVSWLSANTGRPYRLPSEAEWEYCRRAGASDPSVDQSKQPNMDLGGRPGVGRPVAVGSSSPNAFGVSDMDRTLREFVADSWHEICQDPPAPREDGDISTCSMWRIVRGGGRTAQPGAHRDRVHHNQRMPNMGFRVACDL